MHGVLRPRNSQGHIRTVDGDEWMMMNAHKHPRLAQDSNPDRSSSTSSPESDSLSTTLPQRPAFLFAVKPSWEVLA